MRTINWQSVLVFSLIQTALLAAWGYDPKAISVGFWEPWVLYLVIAKKVQP